MTFAEILEERKTSILYITVITISLACAHETSIETHLKKPQPVVGNWIILLVFSVYLIHLIVLILKFISTVPSGLK